MAADNEDAIRMKAYQLWLDADQPEGSADEHWEKAKLALVSGQQPGPEESAPASMPPVAVEVPRAGAPPKNVLKPSD